MFKVLLVNRIVFVLFPMLLVLWIYLLAKIQSGKFGIEFIDVLLILCLYGLFRSYKLIKNALALRRLRNKIIRTKDHLQYKAQPINYPTRVRLVEFEIYFSDKKIEIFRDRKPFIDIDKAKGCFEFLTGLFREKIKLVDVDFILLEYHRYKEYTFKGLISRGDLDNLRWQVYVSVILKTGRVFKLFGGSIEESIYEIEIVELVSELRDSDKRVEMKDYIGIGERVVEALSNDLKLGYITLDYTMEQYQVH